MLRRTTAAAAAFFVLSALPGQASDSHTADHSMHDLHGATGTGSAAAAPTEPGQSAFAAIAEIVELLSSDPQTDWSRVDIDGLREHLVDMNALTLNAAAETTVLETAVVFRITGEGKTLRAIQTMVPAHAAELSATTPWQAVAQTTDDGAVLTVSTDSAAEREKIAALGFFGVMATGAHHQAHHLQMATGGGHAH